MPCDKCKAEIVTPVEVHYFNMNNSVVIVGAFCSNECAALGLSANQRRKRSRRFRFGRHHNSSIKPLTFNKARASGPPPKHEIDQRLEYVAKIEIKEPVQTGISSGGGLGMRKHIQVPRSAHRPKVKTR